MKKEGNTKRNWIIAGLILLLAALCCCGLPSWFFCGDGNCLGTIAAEGEPSLKFARGNPLVIVKDEDKAVDEPIVIIKDEDKAVDEPIVIVKDEDKAVDEPIVIIKDDDSNSNDNSNSNDDDSNSNDDDSNSNDNSNSNDDDSNSNDDDSNSNDDDSNSNDDDSNSNDDDMKTCPNGREPHYNENSGKYDCGLHNGEDKKDEDKKDEESSNVPSDVTNVGPAETMPTDDLDVTVNQNNQVTVIKIDGEPAVVIHKDKNK